MKGYKALSKLQFFEGFNSDETIFNHPVSCKKVYSNELLTGVMNPAFFNPCPSPIRKLSSEFDYGRNMCQEPIMVGQWGSQQAVDKSDKRICLESASLRVDYLGGGVHSGR